MTNTDVKCLLQDLETNERKCVAILDMIDGGFDITLIRQAVEQLCNSAESLKLGVSSFEEPYNLLQINKK